jgi:L-amino acid N-acyltransferase YncA
MKLDYSTSEFLKHIQLIYNHSINKGSTTIETTSKDGSE